MKKEYVEFLKDLQHEMLTQDTVGQANPRYWVVLDKRKIYTDYERYYDGEDIMHEGDVIGSTLRELFDYIMEIDDEIDNMVYNEEYDTVEITEEDGEIIIFMIEELINYLCDECDYDKGFLYIKPYKYEKFIVPDTMFLTLRECTKHIRTNAHHYNNPIPYEMTAWRSPQVAKLYEILETTDWENI